MKPIRRLGIYSQLFVEKKLPTGHVIYIPYVEDLSDEELQLSYDRYVDSEDYEYCQALAAEANKRNLKLRS
jgi:hypothetical protein